ncbi:hypothetical protein LVD15_07555 [Fulvivirga maritima]|uniref:hypothetical protein n=1 Tax=Fulvivirga maritima TaxID=2904247 RepID=UPI001F43C65F|nr:hypothetical protein [Fulvivirga maritima]UII28272.1 hypothetical protein LVD15_07555 [Fulvivirga maritima]
MKIICLLVCFITCAAQAQTNFVNGYFIDNQNIRTDCLIKDQDWKNNPTSFTYKLDRESQVETATIEDVQEFGISDYSKYIRQTVLIDRSSEEIKEMSSTRAPENNKETLFLMVLVEGAANLYGYQDGNLRRFFFSTQQNDSIRQLVFKSFKIDKYEIGTNQQYKQQIKVELPCEKITDKQIENLGYNKKDLLKLFNIYNQCGKEESDISTDQPSVYQRKSRNLFKLGLRVGLGHDMVAVKSEVSYYEPMETDYKITLRLGAELEFILPFWNEKVSLILEPNYKSFQSSNLGESGMEVDYSFIEIPLGVRYNFYLTPSSTIFLNAQYAVVPINRGNIHYKNQYTDRKMKPEHHNYIVAGLGVKIKRFTMEARIGTQRDVSIPWESEYKSTNIILGYHLF